jgi:hypothetical protein
VKLLIGTPTYNGSVTGLFTQSLVGLFRTLGWQAEWRTTKAVLIVHARNQFASLCLEGDWSHLLFLDADVDFHPRVVERMLAFDQPLVAAAYPHRALSIPAFHAAAQRYDRPQVAMAAALTFPVELMEPRMSRGEFHRATLAPTGMMLIRREVFEAMRDAYPELYCATAPNPEDFGGLEHVLQCFDPLADARGLKMGEDVSFCRRWTDLGGDIWVTFDESIGHTGPYTFRAAPGGS